MTAPLLELRTVRKDFALGQGLFAKRRILTALDGIDLSIAPGETLALVGESGCGKSTLGRIVAGLMPATAGEILFDGHPPARGKARARQIQIVMQDPFGALNPKMSVGELIAEPALLHGLVTRGTTPARVAELLSLVGLPEGVAPRYPHALSGGQRQRVAIARALATDPKLIVADEAVSALDVSVQAQIANLLKDIQARTGVSLLFISHGLSLVHHISDRVAVMYLGRIVEDGPTADLFARPRHPYTRALISATPEPVPGSSADRMHLTGEVPSPLALPSGCRFRTRCPHATDICAEVDPPRTAEGAAHVACHLAHRLPAYQSQTPEPAPRLQQAIALYRAAAARLDAA
ncbi:ABC transporter ATP-binding protein [Chachezhania antarctica]|uniref:ABC transporter ATP-binding protein n=1 Tax=Chachezhania antarctica TaxID=2340860 RepID=UPI000EADDD2C|nr:ABC transporter ATP-binding protein [Chachezhania antarctica]|tara:strand:+ start:7708 stop:8754 length:1047 start_codon:yes stop_codon:yes gene_type:complete